MRFHRVNLSGTLTKRVGLSALGVTLLIGGGGALAASVIGPLDSNGVVHGCWTNAQIGGSHAFVLQDAGTSCPKGTTAISWNQAGPAGATGPQGQVGPSGAGGPQGPPGSTGPAGPAGAAGRSGADGKTVLSGAGAPASSVGNDGDFYIDTVADVLYGPKTGGSWPKPGSSLVGNTGAPGATGQPGPVGATGPQGPAGPKGDAGPAGPAGPAGTAGGVTNLDSLIGTRCDIGTSGEGNLNVTYTPNNQTGTDAVNLACDHSNPNQTFALNVSTNTGRSGSVQCVGLASSCPGVGIENIRSAPGTINCFDIVSIVGSGLSSVENVVENSGTCAADYTSGATVTLTATLGTDVPAKNPSVFGGWSGCDTTVGLQCIVTMNAVRNVTVTVEPAPGD